MKLLGKRIIVREIQEDRPESLIYTEAKEEKPFFIGEIVATGTESGLSTGSRVLLNRYIGGKVEWAGEELWLYAPEEVIAIDD